MPANEACSEGQYRLISCQFVVSTQEKEIYNKLPFDSLAQKVANHSCVPN